MRLLGRTLLLGCALLVLTGMGRVNRDLSQSPKFAHVMGKELRSKVELVIYHFKGKKNHINISKIGGNPYLPKASEMKKAFPFRFNEATILGILPKGSEFRVVKAKEEGSTGMSFIHYYVEITKTVDQQWLGKIMDLETITVELVPKFETDYVEELTPNP